MAKQDIDHDTVRLHIAAPAERLYELVADVTRMPEFSPEILECHWVDGADGPRSEPASGRATRCRARPSWTNKPVVTDMQPGRVFSFARTGSSPAPWNGAIASSPTRQAPAPRSRSPTR